MSMRLQRRGSPATELPQEIFADWSDKERWLFIAPHDDDIVIGGGLLLQLAGDMGVEIGCLITTDGDMGYCHIEQRDQISAIRRREALASFKLLGITAVDWLGFPDNDLYRHAGRHPSVAGERGALLGYGGLQNSYTYHIRHFRPTRLFIMAESDYHPDHKLVYQETRISMFHASGSMWPELGPPLPRIAPIYEMATYTYFTTPPDIRLLASARQLELKLQAIAAYQSQLQIEQTVNSFRRAGAVEYLREVSLDLYDPSRYASLFSDS